MFIMHPAWTWHVSEDGHEGQSFSRPDLAVADALKRASVLEANGRMVQVRKEGEDGTWTTIRG
jgi:hypothetical protein